MGDLAPGAATSTVGRGREEREMVTVRNAKRNDAPDIAKVYVDSWRESYAGLIPDWVLLGMSYRRLTRAWDRAIRTSGRKEAILVAEDPDFGIVGLGSCGPSRDRMLPYFGEVYTLYVHPNHVGQGNGSTLLSNLFDSLDERGNSSAVVWAMAENPHRQFYKQQGGGIVATRKGRQWGVPIQEVAYGWSDIGTATGCLSGGKRR